MKIIMILTNRYDPDVRVYKEAKYLVKNGHDVEILCWDREADFLDTEKDIQEGIKIKRFFNRSKYGSGYKQIKSYFGFLFSVRKYLKNKQYDYLHCHDLDGSLVGLFVSKPNKRRFLIFDMHEHYEIQGRKRKVKYLIRFLVKFVQRKSYKIIYVNEIQMKPMRKKDCDKLIYIPNYPDLTDFEGATKKPSKNLRVSYIGAVRQYEMLKTLFEACSKSMNVHIKIHGFGTAYKKLKAIENDYDNVEVTGKFEYKKSLSLYNNTDIHYVVYSNSNIQHVNSYPVKFFESLATYTPIIVNNETKLSKFVKEHNIGYVVDATNKTKIKNLIESINVNSKEFKTKIENIKVISEEYSWNKVVKGLDDIYS